MGILCTLKFGAIGYMLHFAYQNLLYIDFTHEHQMEECDRHIRSKCDVERTRIIGIILPMLNCQMMQVSKITWKVW